VSVKESTFDIRSNDGVTRLKPDHPVTWFYSIHFHEIPIEPIDIFQDFYIVFKYLILCSIVGISTFMAYRVLGVTLPKEKGFYRRVVK
jgi:hypothetical protein